MWEYYKQSYNYVWIKIINIYSNLEEKNAYI